MARHDVAAEFVTDPQRAFEIDRGALDPVAEVEQKGLGRGLHRETAGLDGNDGQAQPEQAIEAPSTISAVS